MVGSCPAYSEKIALDSMSIAKDIDNIYVHKLSSDKNSTDFLIVIMESFKSNLGLLASATTPSANLFISLNHHPSPNPIIKVNIIISPFFIFLAYLKARV